VIAVYVTQTPSNVAAAPCAGADVLANPQQPPKEIRMTLAIPRLILVTVTLIAIAACGNDAAPDRTEAGGVVSQQAAVASADALPERHRRNLLRALENADAGKSPTMACTSVIARAAGNPLPEGTAPAPEDVRAFEMCYVDASARYIQALLAQITPASSSGEIENTCARIAAYAVISRVSLGSFAGNIQLDVPTLDGRMAALVNNGITAKCPSYMSSIRGTQ